MMTQPTSARLLDVARQELADHILPAVADPQLAASLQMIQHILTTLAVRAEHEVAWMCEEVDEIEAMATELLPDFPAVSGALGVLTAAPIGSLHLAHVTERYALGSEVLSCLLDAVPVTDPRRPDVEGLLNTRLAHEAMIMGEFSLVGRH